MSREGESEPRAADRCAPEPSAGGDLRASVLALQRAAGNRAVAGLVARRMLQRSATLHDRYKQGEDDVRSVEYLLRTGRTRLVQSVEPDPGEPTEVGLDLVVPEEVAASDTPETLITTPPTPFSFTGPSQDPFTFTSSEPFVFTASPPQPTFTVPTPQPTFNFNFFTPQPTFNFNFFTPQPTFDFTWPQQQEEEEGGGMKRLRGPEDERGGKRRAVGHFFSTHPTSVPLQQQVLATWPSGRRRVARKNPQPGTFKPLGKGKPGTAFTWAGTKAGSATRTRTNYVPHVNLTSNATTLATGINTHANMNATAGATRGTATEMKVKRWIVVKGTGTAQNVRPAGWDRFQSLCGFIDKSHKCVYVQGHLLYERLGGRGNKMANLAPFTASLNKRHQNQVEKPLWEWLKAAKKKEERTIDYQVVPSYGGGGPAAIVTHAQGYFQRFVDNRNAKALATFVKLGVLDATDVAAVSGQARNAAVALGTPLTTAATWDALCTDLEQEIADYVNAAFPTQIECYARLYKRTGGAAADWDKTQTRHHTLLNHP